MRCFVCVIGCPLGRTIQCIVPSTWPQEGFTIGSVKVEKRFKVSLVVARVRLWADQSSIQVQIDLFDNGVGQIVGRLQFFSSNQISPIVFFQCQFHSEVTPSQIGKTIQPRNDKFHGVNACRRWLDGNHSIGNRADVCFWNLEQIESTIRRSLRHVVSRYGIFSHFFSAVVFFFSVFFADY